MLLMLEVAASILAAFEALIASLRAWFIALGDGIGIHGTSEEWTVGTSASHGCIRMHASDVEQVAKLTPVGTPVLIH